jgi:hypothetical protein
MTRSDIQSWISYWTAAKMVSFDEITSFDRVYQARKYCECMRTGVFADVTDLQIWNALQAMRQATA